MICRELRVFVLFLVSKTCVCAILSRFSISEEITHGITPKGELQLKILLKHDLFSFAFLFVVKADVRSRMETSDLFSEARQSLQNETCWGICICHISQWKKPNTNMKLGSAKNKQRTKTKDALCTVFYFSSKDLPKLFFRISLLWESSEKSDILRRVHLLLWAPSSLRGHWVVVRSCGPCSLPSRF